GMPVAVNLDGIERKRAKWNWVGRSWYLFGEICSVLFASRMIADADVIRDYYRARYFRDSEVLRYGSQHLESEVAQRKIAGHPQTVSDAASQLFRELGVRSGSYILYVSRLEPENNAHRAIAAYNALEQDSRRIPLLIVGDAPYSADYIANLKREAGPGVIFAGYRFGEAYRTLQEHAFCYIQATEVGGTHPALVEAMGFANCVIANRTPEHEEVLADAGLYYEKNDVPDLTRQLSRVLNDSGVVLAKRKTARARAEALFDWDKITSSYEELFYRLTSVGSVGDGSRAR
ncbi:MAG: glycosyltransferase, partial [Bdellovibrionales bacterium]|nr:glycosyltransferase [Bdellovibrionales bacterium]